MTAGPHTHGRPGRRGTRAAATARHGLFLGASGSFIVATRSGSTWTAQAAPLSLANASNIQTAGPGSPVALVAAPNANSY